MPIRDEDSVDLRLDRLERTLRELLDLLDRALSSVSPASGPATFAQEMQRTEAAIRTLHERLER